MLCLYCIHQCLVFSDLREIGVTDIDTQKDYRMPLVHAHRGIIIANLNVGMADKVHKQGEHIPQHGYISHNYPYRCILSDSNSIQPSLYLLELI